MTALNVSHALGLSLVLLLSCARPQAGAPEQASTQKAPNGVAVNTTPVDPGNPAVVAFQKRLKEYVDFHNKVEATVPKLDETPNPERIAAREKALADALIKARPHAKAGDYFIKEVQPHLEKAIHADFAKRPVAQRKALIVELPKDLKVGVNTAYPTTLPLATFPPKLLQVLPELPPEIEYRIVGRHLILRDNKANVVVDIMTDVFPIPR